MVTRLFASLLAVTGLFAQSGFYPVAFDQDQLGGAPDFGFLNHPLTAADRLFVRDGHFFRVGDDLAPGTADDQRVRLFGVNLAFGANFPSEGDAARIARRLRRLGVNLVRLHHMDTQPDSNPANAGSLLTTGPYPTLNPEAVPRLRAFLDALRTEGIYANLNLHVGYTFRPQVDSVPAPVPSQSKPLHVFFPRMVELQVEYTRQVMEALRLKDDPVLGMVEINNESSLVYSWQASAASLDSNLGTEYREELKRQWNVFLAGNYPTTDALRAAWGGEQSDGPELLSGAWVVENHSPAKGTAPEPVPDQPAPAVQVRVLQGGGWVYLKTVGFSLEAGKTYLAEAEIRADLPPGASRNVTLDVKEDTSPWRTQASRTMAVTAEWQPARLVFRSAIAMNGNGRFAFDVQKLEGYTVAVRNWSLREVGGKGLAAGESLEDASVSLLRQDDWATDARGEDFLRFLADRDGAYLRAMRDAVRAASDGLVPVTGTQMGYGGLLNLDTHAEMDYDDNHFYVDHYGFPNQPWDGRDWTIRDDSSTGGGLGAFQNMALTRSAGRPYTVSEFNQPWPNTHAAEILPALASFAAFQDWDSIIHFAYSHGRNWDDGVPNGFNLNGDWTKFAAAGQAAWLFRSGAIQSGLQPVELPVSERLRIKAARDRQLWALPGFLTANLGYKTENVFLHPVKLVKTGSDAPPVKFPEPPAEPYRADTGELTYDRAGRRLLIHAEKAAGAIGFLGWDKVATGAVDIELGAATRGFASVLLTSLDGRSIAASTRLLLTNPGYTLRTQPDSDPQRPQALVNYGNGTLKTLEREPGYPNKMSGNLNGGQKPVWMERVEATVTLRTALARPRVYPLDGAGNRLEPLPEADVERVDGGFRIRLQAAGQVFAPWYEITGE